MSDKPTPFYIVFSPDGEAPAKVTHATHGAAHYAAQAMAKLHKGQSFYVMRSAGRPQHMEESESEASAHG